MLFLEQDFCASDPCQNGGICFSERSGYYCECKDDYAGRNCDRGQYLYASFSDLNVSLC
jgi:hypothetical protein